MSSPLPNSAENTRRNRRNESAFQSLIRSPLRTLASLKLTVFLLAFGLLLTWIASLQQTRMDIWEVKKLHFHYPVVYVPLETFCVPAWTPQKVTEFCSREINGIKIGLPLPSGALIMILMLLNLAAAHSVRFRIKGKGVELIIGLIVFGLGALLTAMVVLNGQNSKGFQAQPIFTWYQLWVVVQVGLGAACVSSVLGALRLSKQQKTEKGLLWLLAVLLAALVVFLIIKGRAAFIGDSAMRIMWQLIQGGVGSLVMLVGCHFIFGRKSGIVLLHLGLVLLMLGEFFVTYSAKEQRMTLREGETVSHTIDIRDFEMAIISKNADQTEDIVTVPGDLLKVGDKGFWAGVKSWIRGKNQDVIDDHRIPFKIRPIKYYRNSGLENLFVVDPDNLATQGVGLNAIAYESPINTGTSSEQTADFATVYAELIDKKNDKPLGIFMLNQQAYMKDEFALDEVTVGDKTYRFGLRFKHAYKPYSIHLHDTKQENYPGTNTPKSFSSEFQVVYPSLGFDVQKKVWMNNPLRFGNETFYQQGYEDPTDGPELSVLQIVKNTGWMIPYICAMMVAFGLLAQFGQTLLKYLHANPEEARSNFVSSVTSIFVPVVKGNSVELDIPKDALPVTAGTAGEQGPRAQHTSRRSAWITLGAIAFMVLFFGYWFYAMSKPKKIEHEEMRLDLLAEVPIIFGGRIQPLDSLSKNVIKKLTKSGRISKAVSLRAIAEKLNVSPSEARAIIKPLVDEKLMVALLKYEDLASGAAQSNPLYTELKVTSSMPQDIDSKQLEAIQDLFDEAKERQKPIRWFADLIFTERDYEDYFVFKINHPGIQQALKLERRKGHRYTYGEVAAGEDIIASRYSESARLIGNSPEKATSFDHMIVELADTFTMLKQMIVAFDDPLIDEGAQEPLPVYEVLERSGFLESRLLPLLAGPDSSQENWQSLASAGTTNYFWEIAKREKIGTVSALAEYIATEYVRDTKRPLVIKQMAAQFAPVIQKEFPELDEEDLRQLIESRLKDSSKPTDATFGEMRKRVDAIIEGMLKDDRDSILPGVTSALRTAMKLDDDESLLTGGILHKPEVDLLMELKDAYRAKDSHLFNQSLEQYLAIVHANPPKDYSTSRLKTESWLNRTTPFFIACFGYLFAFVLSVLGWLGWRRPINRVAFSLVVIAMIIHALGLFARIYISGRAPVTNLYSSALLIGLASALFFLVAERILKIGVGNLLAGAVGFITLLIAMNLSYEQMDTMSVLRAVLDTDFWLWTHVVIVSLGYSATYAAGLLGMTYILGGVFSPLFNKQHRRNMIRMIYGITCFGLLFSFVGTVLGGLWADDSWGRFWGWDVKENGALMIVLVNAIVLHARWGGMVRDRGMAVLAVLGNIVVTWSWFAVNDLGVGLHSYGGADVATSEISIFQTKMFWIFLFWGSQLLVMALGVFLPKRFWISTLFEQRRSGTV